MFKRIISVMGLLFIMILFSGTANALENPEKNLTVIDNGIITNYNTTAETLKEFFHQQNINISSCDKLNYNLSENVTSGMKVEIERPFIIKILIDGQQKSFSVQYNETVGDLINTLKKEYGKDFVCQTEKTFKLRNCTDLKFYSKRVEIVEQKESIPFETKIISSDNLQKGHEQIVQEGTAGEKIVTKEITFVGDTEISHNVKSEKVIKKPIEKIIMRGTGEYKNVLIMNASAYTAGYESTGKRPGDRGYGITASGTKAVKGTVAVDPKVIPLGSKLYVEGYGYATALDTGSAIKGNKIDLFYDSLYEAKKFGRKNLTVYVL